MRVTESKLVFLFSARASISSSVFRSSSCFMRSARKLRTSWLQSAGFCSIFCLSSRGMRTLKVSDMFTTCKQHVDREIRMLCKTIIILGFSYALERGADLVFRATLLGHA